MPGVNSIKLLTGNSHPRLAEQVADRLGIQLTPCIVKKFADQCIDVRIGSSVRDEDVFVLQTGYSAFVDPNDALLELCIIISACKTASARRITAVIPSFPYSRHDKKDKSRAPITAKLVADMIGVAGADHVITMDLHASQIQGFFNIPVDNLSSEPSVARWIRTRVPDWRDSIIVSPDAGGAKRATSLADLLGVDFALINRNRKRAQNKRIREAQAQAKAQVTGQLPSAVSSTDDLTRSGILTPHVENASLENSTASLPSINDRLRSLHTDEGPSAPSTSGSPMYSVVGNGVEANASGELFFIDEDGRRVYSGGAPTGPGGVPHPGEPSQPLAGGSGQGDASRGGQDDSAMQESETRMEILVGDVKDKVAILVDDMTDTGRTLALAAKTLRDAGAREVYVHISHGILSGRAVDLIKKLDLKRLVVTNTIPNEDKARESKGKMEIMDISAVLAESIRRAHHGESIAVLFEEQGGVMV